MAIETVDLNTHPAFHPEADYIKKPLYQSPTYHVWLHVDELGTIKRKRFTRGMRLQTNPC